MKTQSGTIKRIGRSWYGRWREDVIENGRTVRKQRFEKLPILRGVKGGPLDLNMLVKRVIRPALRNRENYRDPEAKNWKPLEWYGFYSLR